MHIKLKDLLKLNENGELGDRLVLGYPSSSLSQGGAVGNGAINLKPFDSPEIVQDPKKFGSMIDKSNLVANNRVKNISNVTPLSVNNPEVKDFADRVNKLKYKVTPDEVICGYRYELNNMVLKDSNIALRKVLDNLEIDPKYYSELHMLGVYPGEKEDYPSDISKQPITPDEIGPIPSLFEMLYKNYINSRIKKHSKNGK